MKKIALAVTVTVVVLLVLTALALPFWFGMETEKTYRTMLERLSHSSGLHFTSKNYERGWLSSTAETVVRHPEIPVELIARHRISHGPLPLDRILDGEWRLTPAQARITSRIFFVDAGAENAATLPPLTAETVFRVNGDGAIHVEIPSIKKTGAQGQILDWRGLSGDMTFDREWKKFRFDMRMPALALTAPGQQEGLSLSKLSLRSDLQEKNAGYFFGDGVLTVGQLEFGNANGRIGLQGLEVSTSAYPSGDTVNLVIRYQLEEARTADERLGPGQLIIEARRLDAAALVKFKNEVDAIYRGNRPTPQATLLVAGKAMQLIAALSQKAPELEITRLSIKTKEGEISGKAKFVLDGRRRNVTQNPLQSLLALSGNLEVSIPAPVLKRLLAPLIRQDIEAYRQNGALTAEDMAKLNPQAMAEIIDRAFPYYLTRNEFTRYLVEQDGIYKMNVSIRQGQLLINGKPWHTPTQVSFIN